MNWTAVETIYLWDIKLHNVLTHYKVYEGLAYVFSTVCLHLPFSAIELNSGRWNKTRLDDRWAKYIFDFNPELFVLYIFFIFEMGGTQY